MTGRKGTSAQLHQATLPGHIWEIATSSEMSTKRGSSGRPGLKVPES